MKNILDLIQAELQSYNYCLFVLPVIIWAILRLFQKNIVYNN